MIFELFWDASLTVKLVMLVLIVMSVFSWHIIVSKITDLNKRCKEIKYINNKLMQSGNSLKVWYGLSKEKGFFSDIMRDSYEMLVGKKVLKSEVQNRFEIIKESMEILIDREIQKMKRNSAILATIGSVSPYIGLFGTVIGIMSSFIAIGEAKQATLEYVAPGIAEALIATGIGLFTAIPAYIAFNIIANKIQELDEEYNLLKDEFCIKAKKAITENLKRV